MRVWKILHSGSGLFYQPYRGRFSDKTNLGPRGKVYQIKPDAAPLLSIYVSARQVEKYELEHLTSSWGSGQRHLASKSQFRVIEYECTEIKEINNA